MLEIILFHLSIIIHVRFITEIIIIIINIITVEGDHWSACYQKLSIKLKSRKKSRADFFWTEDKKIFE